MVELLLFPNQLFEPKLLKSLVAPRNISKIHFIEDPLYYGEREKGRYLKLNQLRIVYMYVVHKHYLKMLRKEFNVEYHTFDKPFSYKANYVYIDPCDILIEKKLEHMERIDSPSFLMSREDLSEYKRANGHKKLQHRQFYNTVKKKLGLLEDVKNMDKYNRAQFSKKVPIPENQYAIKCTSAKEWIDAIEWIKTTRFSNNPQPLTWDIDGYLTKLPVTSEHVVTWMTTFFKERFIHYGKYQDIIYDKNPLFYHSGASIYLNNGLIIPSVILKMAQKYKKDIESYEGFVRQIIGWREYTRYYYHTVPKTIYKQNPFKLKNKQLSAKWYNGTTEIPIINKTIIYAMNYGYINHIQRLMVISNYMTLSEYHPDMIYKWMFEFSLDSYEWVMIFNSYGMGSYSDNGFAMRKPYISSSNYILRMSNETKGTWQNEWDLKYKMFIEKYSPKLY